MKKILIWIPFFISTNKERNNGFLGGAPLQSYKLAKKLLLEGNDVSILCLNINNSKSFEKFDRLKIYRIGEVKQKVNFTTQAVRSVLRVVKPEEIFMFFIYSGNSEKALAELYKYSECYSSKLRIRFGLMSDFAKLSKESVQIIENVQSVLVNKVMVKPFTEYLPKASFEVCENSADKSRFRMYGSRYKEKLRKKYGFDKSTYIVLFVGRFVESKGVRELIEALLEIPFKQKIIGLFVGNDRAEKLKGYNCYSSELKFLSIKYPNRFKYLGEVAYEKMPQVYNIGNLFCLPSKVEGLSNALVEAKSCGLDLLVSCIEENKIGGVEVIDDLPQQLVNRYMNFMNKTDLS